MLGSLWLYPILFLTGLVAGVIDSIAGGGGLITLPVALAVGMPPKIALGTNKFQSSFGSFTATYYYVKHGIVSLRGAKLGIIFTLIGAAAGAWGVQQIDSGILNHVIEAIEESTRADDAPGPNTLRRNEFQRFAFFRFHGQQA